jgi:cytoskeletal protein CcmA (bactofilin family)
MVLKGSRDRDDPCQSRRFTDSAETFDTVIGPDAELKGEIKGQTNVQVLGSFNGDIEIDGLFWLRPGGKLSVTISATDMVIEGEIEGKLNASNKVDVRATARVKGDISSGSVAMADGSFFEGNISMPKGESGKANVVRYEEKRTESAAEENKPEKT